MIGRQANRINNNVVSTEIIFKNFGFGWKKKWDSGRNSHIYGFLMFLHFDLTKFVSIIIM